MSARRTFQSLVRAGVVWLLAAAACPAALLYRTDFENFTAGDNNWAGTDGWSSSNILSGVQGIDQDVIPGGGLGKTAFIGFRQPSARLTVMAKPVNYTPGATGFPLVRVETLIGIQDSVAKTARDSFFVSVWNSAGGYLAGIRFDKRPATYGIWRADGANPDHNTGMNAFDPQYENREVWVIDPATRQSWHKSLLETNPASGLTADVVDSLSSVNSQFYQLDAKAILAGTNTAAGGCQAGCGPNGCGQGKQAGKGPANATGCGPGPKVPAKAKPKAVAPKARGKAPHR